MANYDKISYIKPQKEPEMKRYAKKKGTKKKKVKKISKKVASVCDDLLSTLSVADLHSLINEINSGLNNKIESRFNAIPKTIMKSLVKEMKNLDQGFELTVTFDMPVEIDVEFYWEPWTSKILMEVVNIHDDHWSFVTEDLVKKKSKAAKDKYVTMKKDVKAFLDKIKSTAKQYDLDRDELLSEVEGRTLIK